MVGEPKKLHCPVGLYVGRVGAFELRFRSYLSPRMVSKEVSCTISQFIHDDILDSFVAKGVFSQLSGLSLATSPRIFFLLSFF